MVEPMNDEKKITADSVATPGDPGVLGIEKKARRRLGKSGGRPVRDDNTTGSGGGADPRGEDFRDAGGARDVGRVDTARAADLLLVRTQRAIEGYHHLGHAVTGHAHWKEFDPTRVASGAESLALVIARLPPAAQKNLLLGLAYSDFGLAMAELVLHPALKSAKIRRAEREEKEKDAAAAADEPTK